MTTPGVHTSGLHGKESISFYCSKLTSLWPQPLEINTTYESSRSLTTRSASLPLLSSCEHFLPCKWQAPSPETEAGEGQGQKAMPIFLLSYMEEPWSLESRLHIYLSLNIYPVIPFQHRKSTIMGVFMPQILISTIRQDFFPKESIIKLVFLPMFSYFPSAPSSPIYPLLQRMRAQNDVQSHNI